MPRKVSGFTKRGLEWYLNTMATMLLDEVSPAEIYERASELDGMTIQSLRNRISVSEIKKRALEIAGTNSLEEYYQNQTALELKQEEAA